MQYTIKKTGKEMRDHLSLMNFRKRKGRIPRGIISIEEKSTEGIGMATTITAVGWRNSSGTWTFLAKFISSVNSALLKHI